MYGDINTRRAVLLSCPIGASVSVVIMIPWLNPFRLSPSTEESEMLRACAPMCMLACVHACMHALLRFSVCYCSLIRSSWGCVSLSVDLLRHENEDLPNKRDVRCTGFSLIAGLSAASSRAIPTGSKCL